MVDLARGEPVRRQRPIVKAPDPLDILVQRVHHEVAVGVADAAVAGRDGAVFDGRRELHGEGDAAAVAGAGVGLGFRFAAAGGEWCVGGRGGGGHGGCWSW